jgi:hypothetical protein
MMADDIQIEFSSDDLRAIDFGDQNRFAFHGQCRRKLPNGSTVQPPASQNYILIPSRQGSTAQALCRIIADIR